MHSNIKMYVNIEIQTVFLLAHFLLLTCFSRLHLFAFLWNLLFFGNGEERMQVNM